VKCVKTWKYLTSSSKILAIVCHQAPTTSVTDETTNSEWPLATWTRHTEPFTDNYTLTVNTVVAGVKSNGLLWVKRGVTSTQTQWTTRWHMHRHNEPFCDIYTDTMNHSVTSTQDNRHNVT